MTKLQPQSLSWIVFGKPHQLPIWSQSTLDFQGRPKGRVKFNIFSSSFSLREIAFIGHTPNEKDLLLTHWISTIHSQGSISTSLSSWHLHFQHWPIYFLLDLIKSHFQWKESKIKVFHLTVSSTGSWFCSRTLSYSNLLTTKNLISTFLSWWK